MIDTARLNALRPAERKRAIHGALVGAMEWFRAERMPLRFSDWARTNLGYRGPTEYSRTAMMVAFTASGGRRRICQALLHGWDPWTATPVPLPLLRWWVEQHEGRAWASLRSVTGAFSTVKKGLRRWAKDKLREAARNALTDGGLAAKQPFVHRGELREAALGGRIIARTPRGGGPAWVSLRVDAHPLRRELGPVFRRITPAEITEMQRRVVASVARSLAGATATAAGGLRLSAARATHLQTLLRSARDRRATSPSPS